MQFKKLTVILILMLLAASGMLSGCKSVYDKMKLELSVQGQIELYLPLEDDEDDLEQEGETSEGEADEEFDEESSEQQEVEENFSISRSFIATVSNVSDKVLKEVTYQTSNDNIISVELSAENKGKTEVVISALMPGRTDLTIKTLEGGKSKTVSVFVYKRIEAMTLNENYSLAVSNGTSEVINTAQAINFYPINTNQKDVVYSLKEEAEGVTITEGGELTVTEKTVNSVIVVATSKFDSSLSVEFEVAIIDPIVESDITITNEQKLNELNEWIENGGDETEFDISISEVKLTNNNSLLTSDEVIVQVASDEEYNITATSTNADIVEVVQVGIKQNKWFIELESHNLGTANIEVKVAIAGYENYYATKTFAVTVENIATTVYLNDFDTQKELTVYSNYKNLLGEEIELKVGPVSAINKELKLQIPQEDINKIIIKYSDGTEITGEALNEVTLFSGMSIYVIANEISENEDLVLREEENTVELTFIANSNRAQQLQKQNTVVLKLTQGATDVVVPNTIELEKGLNYDSYPDITFEVTPEDASLIPVDVLVADSGVVEAIKQANNTYKFVAKQKGESLVTVTTPNGITNTFFVKVYVPLEGASIEIESPAQNHNIAIRQLESQEGEYETLRNATVAVSAGIQMTVNNYPSNASVNKITYSSSNSNVASVNSSGYILAKGIGTAVITATIESVERLSDTESAVTTIVKSFELSTYIPIKEINLSAQQIELYDKSTLGYFDLENGEYQLEVNISPNNATFNQENVVWTTTSEYITINDGLISVDIPDNLEPQGDIIANVTASILEYGRYYAKTAVITIKRATKVESITVYNVSKGYVYFDAREGMANAGTKVLDVQTYPYNATNSKLRYIYIQDESDDNEAPVFEVINGEIVPLRAGVATLHIVAEDSFINENEYGLYNEIVVKVADGMTEETSIELSKVEDVTSIDTVNELGLHYVLANDIDFTNTNFTPIGLINGVIYPFTGSINGKFTYGFIEQDYKILGLNLSATLTQEDNYYGFILKNEGVLKNLSVEIKNFAITSTNNSENTSTTLGALVAINDGVIENVTVYTNGTLENVTVSLATRTNYVGIISGVNKGLILTSTSYGDLIVKEESGLLIEPIIYAGGSAGINEYDASIVGDFTPANRPIYDDIYSDTTYINETVLYQKEGIDSYLNLDTTSAYNQNNASGLIAGYNRGVISNVSTDGVLKGLNQLGGVVGVNNNIVKNSFSSSQVWGEQNIGGLIGKAGTEIYQATTITSQVLNNAVEIYDLKSSYESADIKIYGNQNVGGLIGLVEDISLFEYNYVNSYVLRNLGTNYVGDVVINLKDQNENYYVGGLIGSLKNSSVNFDKNYANLVIGTNVIESYVNTPIVYAGGFIGELDSSINITNAYTKGTINLPNINSYAGGFVAVVNSTKTASLDYVYTYTTLNGEVTGEFIALDLGGSTVANSNHSLWDIENSAIWYQVNSLNDNHPILYNQEGKLLINSVPKEVTVTVKDSVIVINESGNGISFEHLKVSDNQAAIMLREQVYDIRDLILTAPANSRYYLTTENTDIVQILDDGSIKALSEGTALIKVSSVLNANVYDTFELAVVKGFDDFVLSQNKDYSASSLTTEDVISLKLQETLLLYASFTSQEGEVGSNVGVSYTSSDDGFTVNDLTLGADLTSTNAHVDTLSEHIITAGNTPSGGNILVTSTPYVLVTLNGVKTRVYINELRKQFYISIYEGASDITTSLDSATIGLKEELILEVYVVTDKQDETLMDPLYSKLEQDETDSIASYIESSLLSVEDVLDEYNEYLYTKYTYNIKAKDEFLKVSTGNGNFKSEKSGTITFTPNSNTQINSNFHITITPQDLLRIDMAHYPSGETIIENGTAKYYPEELPSNIIAPGQAGILKINLYPEYANIDYYEIVSSVDGEGRFVSLEQVALVSNVDDAIISEVSYASVNPAPEGLPYGTSLNLISTKEVDSESGITEKFDGNIYVKTLISSNVEKNQIFSLTLTGYRYNENGEAEANLSKTIDLKVDALPGVTLLYEGARSGYVERGASVPLEVYISDDYEGNVEFLTPEIIYGEEVFIEESLPNSLYSIYVEKEGTGNDKTYTLNIGHGVPGGTTISITAKIVKTINGVIEESISTIDITVVNFLANDINLSNVYEGDTKNTMNLYVGEGAQLAVKLRSNTWYDNWDEAAIAQKYSYLTTIDEDVLEKIYSIRQSILEEVEYSEKMLSRNMKNWYEQIDDDPFTTVSLEENNYINFSIYRSEDENAEDDEYAYEGQQDIFVTAKKVSTNSIIGVSFEFYYDDEGNVQALSYIDNEYVKYPQINQDDEDYELLDKFLYNIKNFELFFNLNITPNSTEDKPIPIYNAEDFANMQAGVDYILLTEEDTLVLEDWVPLTTAIGSLDGNNRTIQIANFATNQTSGSYNFGLFNTISEETVLKNIKIDISLLLQNKLISVEEFDTINFGFLAGINYGTINNADIISSYTPNSEEDYFVIEASSTATVNFGALVAQNVGGYITNSRVGRIDKYSDLNPIYIKSQGVLGGFTAYNSGVITSSYVANIKINNTSQKISLSKTAGFVAVNEGSARISSSYVEGIQTSFGKDESNKKVVQEGGLISTGNIGGFVYENQGEILNSYTNIPIVSSSRSAGFVYQNFDSGYIKNAYSMSKIEENATAHLPFIGSDELDQLLYDGVLENTYYLYNSNYFASYYGDDYPATSVVNFSSASSFNGFGFLDESTYQDHGTWKISTDGYSRPVLPSANEVSIGERELVETKIVDGETEEYYYTDADKNNKRGSENNPILVATAKQFLEAMTLARYLNSEDNENSNYIRLIKDIDFDEILNIDEEIEDYEGQVEGDEVSRLQLSKLQTISFTGVLDGNGMTLNNVRVISSIYTDNNENGLLQSFGMFKQVGQDDDTFINNNKQKAIVKNLNIHVVEISATEAVSVGVLAGKITNSIILNVDITGDNLTVQGRNLVGGLAGIVTGDSRIINITSDLSVSSEYRTTNEILGQIDYSYYNEYNITNNLQKVSYAGGIAGVIDLYTLDSEGNKEDIEDWSEETPKVNNLKVEGAVKLIGEKTGGVIGYIGENTYVKAALFEVLSLSINDYQSLIGYDIVGGVVAENKGKLDHARIEHEENYQLDVVDEIEFRRVAGYQELFNENANIIGGLVGYNYKGIITDSYSRVDVVNPLAKIAGGFVGANYAGSLSKVYTTSHIVASDVIGGLIGVALNESLQDVNEDGKASGDLANINNAFAINNWQLSAFDKVGPEANGVYDKGEDYIDSNDNGVYDDSETFVDSNRAFVELVEGEYAINNSKYIGAVIGQVVNGADINFGNSWYVNEIFSVVGTISEITSEQTKFLREIGNNEVTTSGNYSGLDAIVREGQSQLETITDYSLNTTKDKFYSFISVDDALWTIENSLYPRLRLSNYSDVILVMDENELIDALSNHPKATIIIENDIALTRDWNPVDFRGTLTGKADESGEYPVISNINIKSNSLNVGIFSSLEYAIVSNITFIIDGVESENTQENSTYAVIAGFANNSSISNINVIMNETATLESTAQYSGVIVGRAKEFLIANVLVFTINDQLIDLNIEQLVEYEGLYASAGFAKAESIEAYDLSIENLNLKVKTKDDTLYLGGMVARATGSTLEDIYINIDVNVDDNGDSGDIHYVSAGAGYVDSTILKNINISGNITAGKSDILYLGGAVALMENGSIDNLVYEDSAEINANEYNNLSYIGGLVGKATNTILTNSYAIGSVTAANKLGVTYVGGLLGKLDNLDYEVNKIYAKVDIDISTQYTIYAGGLIGSVGSSTGEITEVSAEGIIDVASSGGIYAGGLIGYNSLIARYAISAVKLKVNTTSFQRVGGLIGQTSANIFDSYVYGTVYSNNNILSDSSGLLVNPVVGKFSGASYLTRVYYNEDISGLTNRKNNSISAKTHYELANIDISDLQNQSNYFTKTAGIYPYLTNLAVLDISEGSLLNPIKINDADDLNNISQQEGKYYLQTQDITYSAQDYNLVNLDGVYNGNGYKIYFVAEKDNESNVALFNEISENSMLSNVGIISNITLIDSSNYIFNIAGIAYQNYGTIYKAYASITVNNGEETQVAGGYYAGLVAEAYGNSQIENSFAKINLNLTVNSQYFTYFGGLVGRASTYTSRVNNSFSTGNVSIINENTGSVYVGGLHATSFGYIYNSYAAVSIYANATYNYGLGSISSRITNSYYDAYALNVKNKTGMSSTQYMVSTDFDDDLSAGNYFEDIWRRDSRYNYGYPYLSFINLYSSIDEVNIQSNILFGPEIGIEDPGNGGGTSYNSKNILATGTGLSSYPYQINHAGRLDWIRTIANLNEYFIQTNNIDLSLFNDGVTNTGFIPIGNDFSSSGLNEYNYQLPSYLETFDGNYDGNNYSIYNLVQSYSGDTDIYTGLFAKTDGADIVNVHLKDVSITVKDAYDGTVAYVGAISGHIKNSTIDNVSVIGDVFDLRNKENSSTKSLYIGGIAGIISSSEINKIYSEATIKASFGNIGGLAGYVSGSDTDLLNSYNKGDIYLYSSVESGASYYIGGLVGFSANINIENVLNEGNIYLNAIAYDYNYYGYHISQSSAKNGGVGGVVGYMLEGSITLAINKGDITYDEEKGSKGVFNTLDSENAVGGVIGKLKNAKSLSVLKNEGDLDIYYSGGNSSVGTSVGGLIGYAYTFNSSFAKPEIEYSANTGNIKVTPVLGEIYHTGKRYGTGKLINVGGLVGLNINQYLYNSKSYVIENSYNAGNIEAYYLYNANIGGIAGSTTGDITSSYTYSDDSGASIIVNEYEFNNLYLYDEEKGYNVEIKGKPVVNVGGIAGYSFDNYITLVSNGIKVKVDIDYDYAYKDSTDYEFVRFNIGGIIGKGYTAEITQSENNITVDVQINYNEFGYTNEDGDYVYTTKAYIGGIAGRLEDSESKIENTVNYGNMSILLDDTNTEIYVGGIAGHSISVELTKLLFAGKMYFDPSHTPSSVYGITGADGNNPDIFTSYILKQTINNEILEMSAKDAFYNSGMGVRTQTSLKQQSNYLYWSFYSMWAIDEGNSYPYLQNLPSDIDITDGLDKSYIDITEVLPQ